MYERWYVVFRSSEGAQGSKEGAQRSREGPRRSTMGQCRGATGGSLKWLPPSRLKLPLLLFSQLDFVTFYRILLTAEAIIYIVLPGSEFSDTVRTQMQGSISM